MTPHPDESLLVLLLDGELDPASSALAQRHVDRCTRCRALYARLAAITREIVELHRPAPPVLRRAAPWWLTAAAAAAAVALLWTGRPAPAPEAPRAEREFIALPFSDESLPLADAPVVRMAVPVESLRQASFRLNSDFQGQRVLADVVLGMDGLPRAIRFVE